MSYDFADADVCIILSPCGLERFNTMVEDLDPDAREEVERLRAENARQKDVISFLGDAAKGLVRDEVDRRKYDQQAVLSLKNGEN